MDPKLIDEAFVSIAARLAGIELTAAQLPGVIANLQRTAQAAQLVSEFPLQPDDELGPVWRP